MSSRDSHPWTSIIDTQARMRPPLLGGESRIPTSNQLNTRVRNAAFVLSKLASKEPTNSRPQSREQATQSTRWMPRRSRPMKDAETGETFRGSCIQAMSPEYPNGATPRSEEHTSELQSRQYLVCRLL